MTRLLLIALFGTLIFSCTREDEQPTYHAKYTYSVEAWESLGSQTLVILEANNSSALDQQITFKVEVINSKGKVFSKDTTIKFNKTDRQKNFQLLIDTEGEIEEVKVTSNQ